ncbi:adenylosuccinate synthetase [Candidatus Bathyarchaeota archaeon]|nr:adenylosuccinate synthetase [Candidatus Bathyarchaeota archaeon]
MSCNVVVGGFFGDEGKGKIVAYLALKDRPAIVARGGVGPNAGHTVIVDGKKYSLRMIPSGFLNSECRLLIGPGVSVDPDVLVMEIETTGVDSRLGIDPQCPVIEKRHIEQENISEHLKARLGSTGSGSGACVAERALRSVKTAKDIPELAKYLADVPSELNDALDKGMGVLVEGTQGTYLSLYHGTYPYCTSKDVCASAICSDVGLGPTRVSDVTLVLKSFVTRVGEGPLQGQLSRDEVLRRGWMEYGTVTGRERRAAPFDFNLARRAVMLNGATQIALTKIDLISPEASGVRSYEELPVKAKEFVERIEGETMRPVTLIGTGPSTSDIIDRRSREC